MGFDLIEIGGGNFPCLGGKVNVVRIVHLGQMIKRSSLLWIRQSIGPSIVCDGNIPFFNINIRRSILTHRPQLDQMTIWIKLLNKTLERIK